jgi:hypothetical protein
MQRALGAPSGAIAGATIASEGGCAQKSVWAASLPLSAVRIARHSGLPGVEHKDRSWRRVQMYFGGSNQN